MGYILLFTMTYFHEATGLFLIISPGARQVAMGSAFTGVADDFTAVYYNTGGIAFCKEVDIGVMYSPWLPGLFPGMNYIYTGGVVPVGTASFGVGWSYFTTGKMVAMDESGKESGSWDIYDYALIFSYGEKVAKTLGIGVSLKYIYSFLYPDWFIRRAPYKNIKGSDATFAIDYGVLYKAAIPGLSIGISHQNLCSDGLCFVKYGISYPIPTLIRVGVGFDATLLFRKQLPEFVSDVEILGDLVRDLVGDRHENWYGAGVEVGLKGKVLLRGGYFCDERDRREGVTYGGGVVFRSFQLDIASDADIYEFPTSNWRVQINFKPAHFMKKDD